MLYWRRLACAALVAAACLGLALPGAALARPAPARPSVVFVHHSVGADLIARGGLRDLFSAAGYNLWDHGYNADGLVGPDGNRVKVPFGVPDDNTDPDGYAAIFAQPVHDPPDNILSYLLSHDVVVLKSCFPANDIASDAQLADYRAYYLGIRATMDRYPDRVFVVVTSPPLNPAETRAEHAARARALAGWLQSDEYLAGHPNVFVYDLFGALADSDGYLRAEYRQTAYPVEFPPRSLAGIPGSALNALRTLRALALGRSLATADSHPNPAADRAVAPLLVQAVVDAHRLAAR